jgi:hypothetical protein
MNTFKYDGINYTLLNFIPLLEKGRQSPPKKKQHKSLKRASTENVIKKKL